MTKTKTGATPGNAAADKVQVVHADVQPTIEAWQWHREHKTPAPLRIGHPETRLTKWIKRETWTPDEAALLVLGFDPDSKRTSPLGFAMIMGLCGGSYTFDVIQRDQRLSIEGHAKQIAEDWRRRVNASGRVNPSEFVGWCLERGVNADWLREVRLPPELTYTALVHAADLLARRTWSPENLPLALRAVLADGWVVRELTAAEMSRPGTGTEKVIYSEADALSIMQDLERPKLQKKIDALLSLGKLPLYEWPSRIPTKERDGAHVKEAELIALLMDGQHLVASQQAVAPPAPHSAPLAAPVAEPQAAPVAAENASAGDGDAWKLKARGRAAEIIKRQRAEDLYPSQEIIADEIAKEFRVGSICGSDGKPLSGATIKRHALKGISSAQGKQMSTSIGRGK